MVRFVHILSVWSLYSLHALRLDAKEEEAKGEDIIQNLQELAILSKHLMPLFSFMLEKIKFREVSFRYCTTLLGWISSVFTMPLIFTSFSFLIDAMAVRKL